MTERRAGIGNIKSISLMVACIQGSDAGQKCLNRPRMIQPCIYVPFGDLAI